MIVNSQGHRGWKAVTESRTLERLRGYLATLKEVEEWCVRTPEAHHPAEADIQRTQQAVLELTILFNQRVSTAQYANMIQAAYLAGTDNAFTTPSLACVRDLKTIVAASITQIAEHPEILDPPKIDNAPRATPLLDRPIPTEISFPEKVTFKWLRDNVPVSLWVKFGSFVIGALVLGMVIGSTYPHLVTAVMNIFRQSTGG